MATKSRGTRARTSKPAPAPKPEPKATKPTPEPKAKPEVTAPSTPTYRSVAEFTPALKAAKGVARGNVDLTQPLQLITHLAWKSPSGSVGWAKGTTANVIAYADDIAVPAGTGVADAMSATLAAARKAVADAPQKDALAVLSKVIQAHTA